MKDSRRNDTHCYRLYIGKGNWVNLDRETTHDLLRIYQNGTQTRYELAPGLYIDILPHDVDCNSKNTDLPRLMRADLNYEENQAQNDTQQALSRYVKSLLESQGIIDAFPPANPGDTLPLVTSLPTHRHLSMVPTHQGAARRSSRSTLKDLEIASSSVPRLPAPSSSSSLSPSTRSTSSYSPSTSFSPGEKRPGLQEKQRLIANRRSKRRQPAKSNAMTRKRYPRSNSLQGKRSMESATSNLSKRTTPSLTPSTTTGFASNPFTPLMLDPSFNTMKQVQLFTSEAPATESFPIAISAQLSSQSMCYHHSSALYNSLFAHADTMDQSSLLVSPLGQNDKRRPPMRVLDDVLSPHASTVPTTHPPNWAHRAIWAMTSGNDEHFNNYHPHTHIEGLETYTHMPTHMDYSEHASIESAPMQTCPPRYDLYLAHGKASSPLRQVPSAPARIETSLPDANVFSYAPGYYNEYGSELIGEGQEQHKYASMDDLHQHACESLHTDPPSPSNTKMSVSP